MPPGRLTSLGRCSRHVPPGGSPWKDPGHAGETMSLGWPGNAYRVPPEELEEVSGVREVWTSLLRLLPRRPGPGSKKLSKKQFSESGSIHSNRTDCLRLGFKFFPETFTLREHYDWLRDNLSSSSLKLRSNRCVSDSKMDGIGRRVTASSESVRSCLKESSHWLFLEDCWMNSSLCC
ncbi:hypothetical protein L3Q82_017168 [Scortum barcoo]|uniref:Uncharacterized protein n=1 Tax=Scortum barcoo TaxID=214431 RepID=A0ACB8VKL8_9TELE|nr:hypothetical protein L3Q82_017168 [Scortum barcoo]